MLQEADLTIDFCRTLVIDSTPSPENFEPGDDYTVKTLEELDLICPKVIGIYIASIRDGIEPFIIDNASILTDRTTTIDDAAMSIYNNAVWGG